MHIHELVGSADDLNAAVSDGYVKVTEHPDSSGLRIWNYTNHAQFDNAWTAATTVCRGLVTNADGIVVARPFRKFFNLSQLQSIPVGDFVVQEKMDGSLGIAYMASDGSIAIATRGSFASEQAIWATNWINASRERMEWLAKEISLGVTPLFEIVYPENRIVVNYGPKEELIYLTSIHIESGLDTAPHAPWPGETATYYKGLDIETLCSMERDNSEGFVLRWECGTRAKIKHEEYVRLHHILTNVSTKTIWELLKSRQSIDRLIDVVPDEFYQWVQETVQQLNLGFTEIEQECLHVLAGVPADEQRKAQADFILQSARFPGIVFAMLDGKAYAEKIWAMLRPTNSKPFAQNVDG
jgi:RNA ligase